MRLRHVLPAAVSTALVLFGLGACGDDGPGPIGLEPDTLRPGFDGAAAQALVEQQVAFGPRIPGQAGHAAQLAWMVARLDSLADEVETRPFTHAHTQIPGLTLQLTNVVARFRPSATRRLLFLAHFDTRPFADQGDTPAERAMPVPGANDGASGTAVLLQVAQHLASGPPTHDVGIDLLFTDGEDYGPTLADMLLGARRYALDADPAEVPIYAVLLDLVGDAEPSFPVERYSESFAPSVVERVWSVAEDLGYGAAFPRTGGSFIQDDHVPLNEAGIPTVNIIDFEYGPGNALWHTPDDLPVHTRASTLEMVGEVVLELIYAGG
ncbi:MAG: M28 family peptidase [Gemmatimonadetes bacterium]|nr:M28 family peptidase [Gemmatimonadota bacterium]